MQRWWGCALVAAVTCTGPAPTAPIDAPAAPPDGAPPDPDAAAPTPLHLDPSFDGDGARRLPDGVAGAVTAEGDVLEVCGVTTRVVGDAVQVDALYTQRIAPGLPALTATWPMPAGWTAPARCVATARQPDDTAVAGFDLGNGTPPVLLRRHADGTFAPPGPPPLAAPLRDVVALTNGAWLLIFDDAIYAVAAGERDDLVVVSSGGRPNFDAPAPIRAVARDPRIDGIAVDTVKFDVVTAETATLMFSFIDTPWDGTPDYDFGFRGSITLPRFDPADVVPLPGHGMLIVGDGAGLQVSHTGAITPIALPAGRPDRAIDDGGDGAYLVTAAASYASQVTITHVVPDAGAWRVADVLHVRPPDLCAYDPAAGCLDWLVLRDAVARPTGGVALLVERRTDDVAAITTPRFPQLLVLTR